MSMFGSAPGLSGPSKEHISASPHRQERARNLGVVPSKAFTDPSAYVDDSVVTAPGGRPLRFGSLPPALLNAYATSFPAYCHGPETCPTRHEGSRRKAHRRVNGTTSVHIPARYSFAADLRTHPNDDRPDVNFPYARFLNRFSSAGNVLLTRVQRTLRMHPSRGR
jgi:hypothetical protein